MGGYLAQEIMRQAPERVLRLALLDTSARADTPGARPAAPRFHRAGAAGEFNGITPRMLPVYLHPDHLGDRRLTGIVLAMAERIGRDAYLRQVAAIMTRPDGREDLRRIGADARALRPRGPGDAALAP